MTGLIANSIGQTTGTWTPTDASGAGLTFTGVSTGYTQQGNIVYAYGSLTFPSTANGSQVFIGGLPVRIGNAQYARAPSLVLSSVAALTLQADLPANLLAFNIVNAVAAGTITNAQLSLAVVRFMLIYPAS